MVGIRPTRAGSPRSAKALLRVARGQLQLLYRFELPTGNSAAVAIFGEERRGTDTIFDPVQSSDCRAFSEYFSRFSSHVARSNSGAVARPKARFWAAFRALLTHAGPADLPGAAVDGQFHGSPDAS